MLTVIWFISLFIILFGQLLSLAIYGGNTFLRGDNKINYICIGYVICTSFVFTYI